MRSTRTITLLAMALAMAVAGPGHTASASASPAPVATHAGGLSGFAAAAAHTVTFVNRSGRTMWIGSVTNVNEPDGDSVNFTDLPILQPGKAASVRIPEGRAPGHWRGRFFARTGCSGEPGSTFHCAVGDCGPFARRCSVGPQPVSLAEFNFDTRNSMAPWYDVSYVDGFSLPITIAPVGAQHPTPNESCSVQGCTDNLLRFCPEPDKVRSHGVVVLCVNPNRDAETSYSQAISTHCPKAYAWSKQDHDPGNRTMKQCAKCDGFTVTFHA
jgi:hypothetical protein